MSKKKYTAHEMREMAECAEKGENCSDLSAMLYQAAEMRERCEALIKKHTVDKYAKCKKCRSAINGRPRSFRGEPCYWHINCGLDEYHFRSGDTEDKIVRILNYILQGRRTYIRERKKK